MMQESAEKRSEFRFPIVLPVEYFKPTGTGILSYALGLSKSGTFISSDDPLSVGSRFSAHLIIPLDNESSKILRMEEEVVWNKIQPFRSKRNGMGVKFIEPLPEASLLSAVAYNVKKLIKEAEVKEVLEERVEELESELERVKRLTALGRYAEKILFDVSNPILTLSGRLETIKTKMHKHKRMLEEHEETNKKEFKGITKEFDNCCKEIDQILKDYKIVSELAHIVEDNSETLERNLKRYI